MYRRTVGAVAVSAVALLVGCTSESDVPGGPNSSNTVTVDAAGGTFDVNGVKVTVPAGLALPGAMLEVSAPKAKTDAAAPFAGTRPTVTFDVSLTDTDKRAVQPTPDKLMAVDITLQGGFLPPGARPEQAVLYTTAPDGSWQMMPSAVDENNVLHAPLTHLSAKTVVYLDEETLKELAGSGAITILNDPCRTSLRTSAGEISIDTARSRNWENKRGSPMWACLAGGSENVALNIRNQSLSMLSVAASGGLKVSSPSSDAEDAIIKELAKRLYGGKPFSAYISRGATATAPLSAGALPTTVRVVGDPHTFIAQSIWGSLNFIVGILKGKDATQTVLEVKKLLDAVDVIDCLGTLVDTSQGKVPSVGDVLRFITSKCTLEIGKALGYYTLDAVTWKSWWGRLTSANAGRLLGWDTFMNGLEGIRLQVNQPMTIVLTFTPNCMTRGQVEQLELEAILGEGFVTPGTRVVLKGKVRCERGWAIGYGAVWLQPGMGENDGTNPIFHWEKGRWVPKKIAGTGPLFDGLDSLCDELPPEIKKDTCAAG